jgi:8-oxo-dGTP pyrophosphatase MutT (NUDIX family)
MPARDQAGVIPFRRKRHVIEVCLIRTRGQRKWKIPKGFVDPGETPRQTALKEAWEEAGLRGRLVGESIGSYQYAKWNLDLTVAVFLMEVKEAARDWDEAASRERGWAPLDDALARLRKHPVKPLLAQVSRRLGQRKPSAGRDGSKA